MESFEKQKGERIKKGSQKIGEEWGTRRWRKLGWKARERKGMKTKRRKKIKFIN